MKTEDEGKGTHVAFGIEEFYNVLPANRGSGFTLQDDETDRGHTFLGRRIFPNDPDTPLHKFLRGQMIQEPLCKHVLMLYDRRERSLQPDVCLWVGVDQARVFQRCRRGWTGDRRDGEEVFENPGSTVIELMNGTTGRDFLRPLVPTKHRGEVGGEGGQVRGFGESNVESCNVRAKDLAYVC